MAAYNLNILRLSKSKSLFISTRMTQSHVLSYIVIVDNVVGHFNCIITILGYPLLVYHRHCTIVFYFCSSIIFLKA